MREKKFTSHMRVYLDRNFLIGFSVSVITLVVLGLMSYFYFTSFMETVRHSTHSRRVLLVSEKIRSLNYQLENQEFLMALQPASVVRPELDNLVSQLRQSRKDLDSLRSGHEEQVARIRLLHARIEQRVEHVDQWLAMLNSGRVDSAVVATSVQLTRSLADLIATIQQEESHQITLRSMESSHRFSRFVVFFFILIGFILLLLALLGYSMNSSLALRHAWEAKLIEAERKTKQVNAELESFSYSVSHDLRAPLRSINGYAKILIEDYHSRLDEEGIRTIETIARNGVRMGRLIDDLLNFSKTGRQSINKVTVSFDEMVGGILKEHLEDEKGRKITVDQQSLGLVYGDHNLLHQVWVNLISNALKYSRNRQESRIEIGKQEAGGRTVYYIRDNGAGFDMQYASKLFGVFQRLHKLTEFEGTGVGLALVKKIIDRHGGEIWAESEVDQGTCFFFTLPSGT